MLQDNLFNSVLEINKATANDLFVMYNASKEFNPAISLPRFIFPEYRDKGNHETKLRISEQEARMLYCFNLNDNKYKYWYSIETSTGQLYNFTEKKSNDNKGESNKEGRSALSDLSIYDLSSDNKDNKLVKAVNVEFKAHNPGQKSYDKDIEKLIAEKVCGNWFHLLKNADNGTIKSLNYKFKSAINKINPENLLKDNKDLWILFFIVILDRNETKHKQLSFSQFSDKNYIEKLFMEMINC
jgi:hypothetical protein